MMIFFYKSQFCEFKILNVVYRPKRTLHSKKYGADLVRFAQDETCAVHSSTKIDGKFSFIQDTWF